MSKFGQEVFLTIKDDNDADIILTSGLRIDFDIRIIKDFSRVQFTVYNLNNKSIAALRSRDGDKWATLQVRMHGGPLVTLVENFYVSNVVDERKLPDIITNIYCTDNVRRKFLEKPVQLLVKLPSLRNLISAIAAQVEFNGKIHFESFPKGFVDELPPRISRPVQGDNMSQCLRELEREFEFNTFTDQGRLLFLYKPSLGNVGRTELSSREPDITLSTNDMRANPVIGIASLSITSNLNADIKAGSILDISELLTASSDVGLESLALLDNYLEDYVSGFSKYQAFSVQHKGSNYTADWYTIVTALSPTKGKLMPANTWFRS